MHVASRVLAGLLLAAVTGATVAADEGMWMLHQVSQLDQAALTKLGLKLQPREIWDPKTDTGLASAVCSLVGCSASFVSSEGLVITNHHCAFRALQSNATPEHDYITDGFLAASRSDELQARGFRVLVFKGYDDVTAEVLAALGPSLAPAQRARALERKEKELIARCEAGGLRCRFAEMFGGGKFYLFRSIELRDVRLVYAPPRAIGEYGGEVDNWMWPRHTGDYSFLRAYVGRDGKPADFSPANVPYRPDRWLKVASEPLGEGDFTMIMGYPGKTTRYQTSAAVAEDAEEYYPQRIAILKDLIAVMEEQKARGKDVEIKLAAQLKGYYNSIKNNQGKLEELVRSGLASRKASSEKELAGWIQADPRRQASYGAVIGRIEELLRARRATRERDILLDWMPAPRASTLLAAADLIVRWSEGKARPDLERELGYQDRDERASRQRLQRMHRDIDLATDRAVLRVLLRRAANLPSGQRLASIDAALAATLSSGDAAIEALLDRLYAGTRLADPGARLGMLDLGAEALAARNDAMIAFANALRQDARLKEDAGRSFDGEMLALEPRLIEALAAWRGTLLYPDANSTLRFTYATVKGFTPRDAVRYLPFTTLRGVVEKHTGKEPFACPPRLLEAAKRGPFPRYMDPRLGDVPACFTSTNDITGGNSGSPIMNGRGELVGLAFDGNWESMTSDYQFDPALSRTINVDISYVLWCMDYVDEAHGLMREMGVEPAQE